MDDQHFEFPVPPAVELVCFRIKLQNTYNIITSDYILRTSLFFELCSIQFIIIVFQGEIA
jgi:hypothetical protein